jgi:S-disulfanyl-L-cysteine oxidoreductase SoxD
MLAHRAFGIAAAGLLLAAVTAPAGRAELPTYRLGRTPTADEIKAWDVTIPPDGKGLPPGSGTAVQGESVYAARCESCHGEKGQSPKYDRGATKRTILVGGRGSLDTAKPVQTIGSFWPYATTLWSYINRAQPFDEPGSLTPDEVYAVTAYLLHLNGIIGQSDVLDARTLPAVKMPNRDGFVPDRRPDVGKPATPAKQR